jgi:ABC-type Fe3+ transport system permease subunit
VTADDDRVDEARAFSALVTGDRGRAVLARYGFAPLRAERVDWFPLLLSLRVASLATLLAAVLGISGAYLLAKGRFPGRGLLEAVASLPIVLPPTVLGYYLLVVLGARSPVGRAWERSSAGRWSSA